jgi:mitochondrial fission protein ELM1
MTNSAPHTWLLLGNKLGDNAQVELLARHLGWSCETRRLAFLPEFQQGKPRFGASLYHVDLSRSDALVPPWPELLITVGSRPSMAALWVQEQSQGRTRLVIIGRPKRLLHRFCLVIATPQYAIPHRENVLHLRLPLMRPDEQRIAQEAAAWRDRLAALPRPITALLVGGPTKPFRFDREVAVALAAQAARLVAEDGGSLYVSTSRRTPPEVVQALREYLPTGGRLFEWTPDAKDNPYAALLGLADRFVVTGDSVSMMVEVARLGRPLAIAPLPVGKGPWDRWRQRAVSGLFGAGVSAEVGGGPGQAWRRLLNRVGLLGYARDLSAVHRSLYQQDLAVAFGEPFLAGGRRAPDEVEMVAARIRHLVGVAAPDH